MFGVGADLMRNNVLYWSLGAKLCCVVGALSPPSITSLLGISLSNWYMPSWAILPNLIDVSLKISKTHGSVGSLAHFLHSIIKFKECSSGVGTPIATN